MEGITLLMGTAAIIAFTHTLFGPDHYLPFIVMSKARKWSLWKTIWITVACGIGHVGSSIVLGSIGIAFGIGISKIEFFEGFRGNLAAWSFIVFGFIYMTWGIYRAIKNKPHKHRHLHKNGSIHVHEHTHTNEHDHVHKTNITPWILFTIFILGPCEPLIPILMYPAADLSIFGMIAVTSVFALITIGTMLAVVLLASYGINLMPFGKLEKYTHAIAGGTIFLSGIAIVFLGL
jgi:sulfite exporter TauE/SafE